ncbi:MAG: aminopeptidase P family protein [Candidatus Cloacimonadota bacterium]|nr:aminopeptidase P family protein [Candidatus Cloacimonadota bacterium]
MKKKFFEKNRKKYAEMVEANSLSIFWGTKTGNGLLPDKFVQDSNFYYFTGIKSPNAILMIYETEKAAQNILFIEREIPEMVVWLGKKLSKDEAKEISGIDTIYYTDEFERILNSYAINARKGYFDYHSVPVSAQLPERLVLANKIKEHYPEIVIANPSEYVGRLRAKKSEEEIANIRKAIEITNKGIRKIFINAKSGMMEYELEAILLFECARNGEKEPGFSSIVASGKNATTLHYEENNCKIGENDLVLLDMGAQYNGYSADISRTFPVSGEFSKRQKEVYEEVLNIQKKLINSVKPGITLKELQEKSVKLMKKALIRLDLIENNDDEKDAYKKYYMHGIGHHLGLQTHDLAEKKAKLVAGSVITIEPGIYIKDEGIGVRIEDDILVTKKGQEVLSAMIPKEINELEQIISK